MIDILIIAVVVAWVPVGILARKWFSRMEWTDGMIGFGEDDDSVYDIGFAALCSPLFLFVGAVAGVPIYAVGLIARKLGR